MSLFNFSKMKQEKKGVLALLEHKLLNLPKEKKHLQTSRKYS
jgi:6-pyruvoyl-tetrahydropterin synthase